MLSAAANIEISTCLTLEIVKLVDLQSGDHTPYVVPQSIPIVFQLSGANGVGRHLHESLHCHA